jgi:hypothetical protein
MSGRIIIESTGPKTQTVAGVVELLKFLNRAYEPLPEVVDLSDGLKLSLSSRKDCYYTQYLDHGGHSWGCTCKAGSFNRPCRHVKRFYARRVSTISSRSMIDTINAHDDAKAARLAEARAKTEESRQQARAYQARMRAAKAKPDQAEEESPVAGGAKRLAKPVDSVRPTGKWAGGHNGPVSDLLEDMKAEGYEMSFEAED